MASKKNKKYYKVSCHSSGADEVFSKKNQVNQKIEKDPYGFLKLEEETANWLKYFNLFNLFDDIFTSDKCTYYLQIWPEELNRSKSNYYLNLNILSKNIVNYYRDTESDFQSTLESSFGLFMPNIDM